MHNSIGAFEVNAAAALVALLAAVVRLASWRKTGHGYMLWLCAGWLGLCVYFSLLAISAGPAPVLRRTDVIVTARALCLVAGSALLLELSIKWFAALREHRRRQRNST